MTATASKSTENLSGCSLTNYAPFVIVQPFTVDSTKLVLLRDPAGATTYSGDWGPEKSQWTIANSAGLPLGYDPTASGTATWKAEGFFAVPIDKFAYNADINQRCLSFVQVGINLSG